MMLYLKLQQLQRDEADEPHNEELGQSCGSFMKKKFMICEQKYFFMHKYIWSGRKVLYSGKGSMTAVRCAVREIDKFQGEVGLHQESAVSTFLVE